MTFSSIIPFSPQGMELALSYVAQCWIAAHNTLICLELCRLAWLSDVFRFIYNVTYVNAR